MVKLFDKTADLFNKINTNKVILMSLQPETFIDYKTNLLAIARLFQVNSTQLILKVASGDRFLSRVQVN